MQKCSKIRNTFFEINKYIKVLFILAFLISCQSKSQKKLLELREKAVIVTSNKKAKEKRVITPTKKQKGKSIKIITWNIQNLGGSKSESVLLEISKIINESDIVAIQEVVAKDPRGVQAVAKIVDQLNRMGSKWDYAVSNPTNSPSAYSSERYAYIWKTSKVRLAKKAFLDKELENICVREPYVALFALKKNEKEKSFYLINFHSRKHNDKPEEEIVNFINYPKRLRHNNIIILGDFNLNEEHAVWDNFYQIGFKSALKGEPTTLKRKCRNNNYRNYAIDNFYIKSNEFNIEKSTVIDFVKSCDRLKEKRKISDHLPVMVELKIVI